MPGQSRDHALDHVVVVVFENRSLDNVPGRRYGERPATPSRDLIPG
jgi:phospholipase C